MKYVLSSSLFVIVLVIVLFPFNIMNATPLKFNYGEIPFGKSVNMVLNSVYGADIQKVSTNIEFLHNYQGFLEKYFNGGFYTASGQGAELLGQVIIVYRVTYKGWDNVAWIDLFFTKGYKAKDDDYGLFMVIKEEKNTSAPFEDVLKSYSAAITDVLKTRPQIIKYRYQIKPKDTPEPAIMGEWIMQAEQVFLLLHNEIIASSAPIIIYRNNQGWQKYLVACDTAEQERKRTIENKIKKNFLV